MSQVRAMTLSGLASRGIQPQNDRLCLFSKLAPHVSEIRNSLARGMRDNVCLSYKSATARPNVIIGDADLKALSFPIHTKVCH